MGWPLVGPGGCWASSPGGAGAPQLSSCYPGPEWGDLPPPPAPFWDIGTGVAEEARTPMDGQGAGVVSGAAEDGDKEVLYRHHLPVPGCRVRGFFCCQGSEGSGVSGCS